MSAVWPFDAWKSHQFHVENPLREFRCRMFMPFRRDFDDVAGIIRTTVEEEVERFHRVFGFLLPDIKRLDWEDSSGIVHQQLWESLLSADLVFCDTTSANPNVMYELGVAAAWKPIHQVAIIRRRGVRQEQPFNIAPLRYFTYDLEGAAVLKFKHQIAKLTRNALIPFPDAQIDSPPVLLPFEVDFSSNLDDRRLYTPPFCHRRVKSARFEFGSLPSYEHSWASVGNLRLLNVRLEFEAAFVRMWEQQSEEEPSKIGVHLRSEHPYANFGHVLVLHADGTLILTTPNNSPPRYYSEQTLRGPTGIDPYAMHRFVLSMDGYTLSITVDDFTPGPIQVSQMERVNGPGLVRFHGTRSWMGIQSISLDGS